MIPTCQDQVNCIHISLLTVLTNSCSICVSKLQTHTHTQSTSGTITSWKQWAGTLILHSLNNAYIKQTVQNVRWKILIDHNYGSIFEYKHIWVKDTQKLNLVVSLQWCAKCSRTCHIQIKIIITTWNIFLYSCSYTVHLPALRCRTRQSVAILAEKWERAMPWKGLSEWQRWEIIILSLFSFCVISKLSQEMNFVRPARLEPASILRLLWDCS